ncbi:uncharacterized protein LOC131163484 [Malania oleifera]|uniref:uncharacterized protein LOC131163484 n=1 Tax=Malania oleifera TaxID=397392 RepID=UPI0025AEBF72|nr:uncharacterized protein LOC131163484 [Malania oleifera]
MAKRGRPKWGTGSAQKAKETKRKKPSQQLSHAQPPRLSVPSLLLHLLLLTRSASQITAPPSFSHRPHASLPHSRSSREAIITAGTPAANLHLRPPSHSTASTTVPCSYLTTIPCSPQLPSPPAPPTSSPCPATSSYAVTISSSPATVTVCSAPVIHPSGPATIATPEESSETLCNSPLAVATASTASVRQLLSQPLFQQPAPSTMPSITRRFRHHRLNTHELRPPSFRSPLTTAQP